MSLPIQEQDGRAFADAERGEVVDVLRVPGHTRRLLDWGELKARAGHKGIDAFERLEAHWKARDFDVLWVRGGDRFARSQAIHARITEEIIQAGMRIYAADDGGWVDKSNYRYWIAMSGAKAAGSVDNFVNQTRKTKDRKAAQGKAVNKVPIWSHKTVRDEFGKIVDIVADRTKELIIRDAAALVIEGVGWHRLEAELYDRHQHTDNGKRFHRNHFYHLFYDPYFWGNSARRYRGASTHNKYKWDLWVFDASYPAPEGALVYYHTHEPYLNGELGSQLKAELIRRRSSVRGGTRPARTHRFAGLFVCEECGYRLLFNQGSYAAYYRCAPSRSTRTVTRSCSGSSIRDDRAQEWFDAALRAMLSARDPYHFLLTDDSGEDTVALIEGRLADKKKEAATLIQKQKIADPILAPLYDEQLQVAAAELRSLQARLLEARQRVRGEERAQAESAYEAVRALPDVRDIWRKSDTEINQILHRLLGRNRISVRKHTIRRVMEPA